MSIKIKVSYTDDQELAGVVRLLSPIVRSWKKQPAKGKYKTHDNPPGINGALVEGRICYDAFVLENKAKAIYYQENKPE